MFVSKVTKKAEKTKPIIPPIEKRNVKNATRLLGETCVDHFMPKLIINVLLFNHKVYSSNTRLFIAVVSLSPGKPPEVSQHELITGCSRYHCEPNVDQFRNGEVKRCLLWQLVTTDAPVTVCPVCKPIAQQSGANGD